MKERPILFGGQMVRAILDGRKTQTRRPVKPMKHPFGHWLSIDDVVAEWAWGTGAVACPLGREGDRLWVREAFHAYHWDKTHVVYRADGEKQRVRTQIATYEVGRWTPSIHMPRWASRITLEITKVRVEKLREITAEDAAAEGFAGHDPIAGFADAWNEIYGDLSWENNQWVWVVEFRRVVP